MYICVICIYMYDLNICKCVYACIPSIYACRVANTPLDLPKNRGGYTLGLLYTLKSICV